MILRREFLIIVFIVISIDRMQSTPIDNGVEGDPEIECGANSITVNFNTRNDFQGHVYVKSRFAEAGCRSDEGGRRVAGIKLPFDQCGTQRSRSLNPKGVFVSNTVVITFHPQFLTKVDRAYTIQCFYMEADKTVSQELEVSEITTAFQTQLVPMPVCQYDILDGGPEGQPVKFASIGQMVYHKWTCNTETTDIFCAVVHSCLVDDGAGNHVQLLDENGCALDKFLLQNLEYSSDLMAGRESHVFKYADKPALFFQCQVTISIKEPAQQCPRPQCGEPGGPVPGPAGVAPPAATPARPPPTRGTTAAGAPLTQPPRIPRPTAGGAFFIAPFGETGRPQPGRGPALIAPTITLPPFRPVAPVVVPQVQPARPSLPPVVLQPNTPSPTVGAPHPVTPGAVAPTAGAPQPAVTAPPPLPAAPQGTAPPPAQPQSPLPPAASPETIFGSESQPPNVGASATRVDAIDFPDRRRRARRSAIDDATIAGVWDVRAQPITAMEIDDNAGKAPSSFSASKGARTRFNSSQSKLRLGMEEQHFCLSPAMFGLFVTLVVASSLVAVLVSVLYCFRRSPKH